MDGIYPRLGDRRGLIRPQIPDICCNTGRIIDKMRKSGAGFHNAYSAVVRASADIRRHSRKICRVTIANTFPSGKIFFT